MAVEHTGTAVSISSASATSSQSITVPSDCNCAVMFHVGAQDSTDAMFGSGGATFTLGDNLLTWQGRTAAGVDNCDASVHTIVNPPAGTQTFAWNDCTEDYGVGLFIVFYKGVDTSNPVLEVDSNRAVSGTITVTGLTTGTGSMTVAAAVSFTAANDLSLNSQTVIINNVGPINTTYLYADVAEKAESSSMSVGQTGSDYACIIAISLRAAPTITLTQHSFRWFNDDGSESAATAKAALNTNVNLAANDVARIRMLIDATGDPTGKQFQLEYRRKPSGGSFGPWDIIEQ